MGRVIKGLGNSPGGSFVICLYNLSITGAKPEGIIMIIMDIPWYLVGLGRRKQYSSFGYPRCPTITAPENFNFFSSHGGHIRHTYHYTRKCVPKMHHIHHRIKVFSQVPCPAPVLGFKQTPMPNIALIFCSYKCHIFRNCLKVCNRKAVVGYLKHKWYNLPGTSGVNTFRKRYPAIIQPTVSPDNMVICDAKLNCIAARSSGINRLHLLPVELTQCRVK